MLLEKWFLKNVKADFNKISNTLGVNNIIAKIIVNRGIKNLREARTFLNPSLEYLYDPSLIKDMDKGVEAISQAIDNNVKIIIYGDYDVDGVCSTAILYKALRYCNADVEYYIPDREKDGYGLNVNSIELLKNKGAGLILTCDNGISAVKEIEFANKIGLQVVITDHHELPFLLDSDGSRKEIMPDAYAVINPKRNDCFYPFKLLCGASIAFKFVQVLFKRRKIECIQVLNFIELAGIATICDVVDLVGENRIIAKNALKRINNTENIGIKALIKRTCIEGKQITSYHIGFILGPSINATGRLENAEISLKLLITEDEGEAEMLAQKLYELNVKRQDITNNGVEQATQIIEKSHMLNDKVLVVYIPEVHESVAGIVAGKIKEKYNLPTIILTKGKDGVKGSGRSIESYNMFEGLLNCKKLLGKFGGHPMAAGLSLEEDNIPKLRAKLNEDCMLSDDDTIPKITIDMLLPIDKADMGLCKDIVSLEPFGKGNPKPIFSDKGVHIIKAAVLGKNKNVIKLTLKSKKNIYVNGIIFNNIESFNDIIESEFGNEEMQKLYNSYAENIKLDIVYNIDINTYNGTSSVQLNIISFRKSK